jgi:hypothetical protein
MAGKTSVVIIVLVAASAWWAYSSHVNNIKNGPQGDPVRAVETLMNTAQTFSGMLWNPEVQAGLKEDLAAWQKSSEEDEAEMPESLKQLGIADPRALFSDEKTGKAALATLSLFHFDAYEIGRTNIRKDDTATVYVSFVPYDFMGMRQAMSGLGAQQNAFKQNPVEAQFDLKKRRHAWRIEKVGGEAADLTRAFRQVGR